MYEKKTTNTLNCFAENDFKNDQIYVQQRTQNHPRDRSRRPNCTSISIKKRKPQRVKNNSDTTGFCLDFDRQMNSFTNPKADQNNRRREVNQEFEYCNKSTFIGDYLKTNGKTKTEGCPCEMSNTGGFTQNNCC